MSAERAAEPADLDKRSRLARLLARLLGPLRQSVNSRRLGRLVQRPAWLAAFAAAVLLSTALFLLGALLGEVRPGSAWGRLWGTLSALLMVAAALLAVRRRTLRRGWGRVQDWTQLHVYGGTLALLLALFHCGFRWPDAGLTAALLGLTLWVTASGLAGVALRKWIPRLLSTGLTIEVLYERIPELCEEIRRRAETVAAACPPAVQELYRKRLAPALARPRVRWIYALDISGGIRGERREIALLRRLLAADEQPRLDELAALYRTKLELDAHYTLQRPLRWWLYAHVPASLVLLLLLAVHVVAVLYY